MAVPSFPLSTKTIFALRDHDGAVSEAAAVLKAGGVVVIPTETVYGLAANALDEGAVARIFEAKGRPQDNPLIVHIAAKDMLDGVVQDITPCARKLMDAYWPGPLSLVMKKDGGIPACVTGGLDTVAVRMPEHKLAREIILAAGVPIAAPSANLSGRPSPTTAQHAFEDMCGRVPLVIDGGPCGVGVESTVVDVTGTEPVVLRPGVVTPEMIRGACGGGKLHSGALADGEGVASPGMKYRHYAPNAHVHLFCGGKKEVAKSIKSMYDLYRKKSQDAVVFCMRADAGLYGDMRLRVLGGTARQVEQALFGALREADGENMRAVLFHYNSSMGLAVKNRISKAAEAHFAGG